MKEHLVKSLSILVCLFSLLLYSNVGANGFVESSTMEKSGNVLLLNSDNLILNEETLDIKLLKNGYEARVVYEVSSVSPYKGKLYFPMICSSDDISRCINYFQVRVDGVPVLVDYKEHSEVASLLGTNYKYLARGNLMNHGYISEIEEYDDYTEEQLAEMLTVKVVSAPIETKSNNFALEVIYKVGYLSSSSGTSKSAVYDYSDDIVYYDFSPAALWTNNEVTKLNVVVDTGGIGLDLVNYSSWKFEKSNYNYTSTKYNTLVEDVPPVILGVNRKLYHQYLEFVSGLEANARRKQEPGSVQYSLISSEEIKSKDGRYSKLMAADNNLTTAWCSDKNNPSITVVIPQSENYGCHLDGVALINGYTKSQKIWRANNRIKSLSVQVSGKSENKYLIQYSKTHELINSEFASELYPYSNMNFIPVETLNIIIDENSDYQHMDRKNGFSIELKVLDVFKGDSYNDTCISEIFPVFNCG